jgi:type IV secretory pathway VirB9-like protein
MMSIFKCFQAAEFLPPILKSTATGLATGLVLVCASASAQTQPPSGGTAQPNSGSYSGPATTGKKSITSGAGAASATLLAGCPLSSLRPASRSAPVARSMPADPRLVVFPYDRNALYSVNAYFGLYTHLEFDEGEEIVGAYVNDETEFEMKVARTGHDVMIRPRNRGAVGSLTIITDRRRYEFDLLDVSGCAEASEPVQRYQRVSFTYLDGVYEPSRTGRGSSPNSELGARQGALPSMRTNSDIGEQATAGTAAAEWQVRLDQLNTNYNIEGAAEISPVSVMDDGRRTIIKFANRMDLRPVLFAVAKDGNAEVVEYIASESTFKINRVFTHGALLKLGALEVKIRNRASACGWFDSACRSVRATNIGGGQ